MPSSVSLPCPSILSEGETRTYPKSTAVPRVPFQGSRKGVPGSGICHILLWVTRGIKTGSTAFFFSTECFIGGWISLLDWDLQLPGCRRWYPSKFKGWCCHVCFVLVMEAFQKCICWLGWLGLVHTLVSQCRSKVMVFALQTPLAAWPGAPPNQKGVSEEMWILLVWILYLPATKAPQTLDVWPLSRSSPVYTTFWGQYHSLRKQACGL